jgi:hypothetical protein
VEARIIIFPSVATRNCSVGEYDDTVACVSAPAGYYVPTASSGTFYSCDYSVRAGAANCGPNKVICDPYDANNASFATRNFGVCSVVACPGATVTASGCGAGNGGHDNDQYLQVVYDGDIFVAQNDDYCVFRSQVSWTVNSSWAHCQLYEIREGCYQDVHCTGTIAVSGAANCPVGTVYAYSECALVPEGFYNPDSPGGTYYICPFSLLPGAANCESSWTSQSCNAGQYFNTTIGQCDPVPAGYYNPFPGHNVFYYCGSPLRHKAGLVSCTTSIPTMAPTLRPSVSPSNLPVSVPTFVPVADPTEVPTFRPSAKPSGKPTRLPTARPSAEVDATLSPSCESTVRPSALPSVFPTIKKPTAEATVLPVSRAPSMLPTSAVPTVPGTGLSSPASTSITSFPTVVSSASPTSSQSSSAVVAVINNLTVVVGSNNVVLSIGVTPFPLVGGRIFCAAHFQNDTALTLTSLQDSASSILYHAATITVVYSLIVYDLAPFTDYNMFCFAKSSANSTASLDVIAGQRVAFRIGCCKGVAFTVRPTSVYGDSSVYSYFSTDAPTYFAVQLSALPTHSVIVRPYLLYMNGSAVPVSEMALLPTQYTVLANSTSTASSFYLNGSAYFFGEVMVRLGVAGISSDEYLISPSENVTLFVLSKYQVATLPNLATAVFSSSGTSIIVTFDVSTDYFGLATVPSWSCSLLLNFPGSSDAFCSWISATQLRAFFVGEEGAVVGDSVILRPDKLGSSCTNALFPCLKPSTKSAGGNTTIRAPGEVDSPTVVLNVPSASSTCDDLLLDATSSSGNGGRSWRSILWAVSVNDNTSLAGSVIADTLNSAGTITAAQIVNSSCLTTATYCFSLTLENFLGASATAVACVSITTDANKPVITVVGGSNITNSVYLPLSIQTHVVLPSCAESVKLYYAWNISELSTGSGLNMASTSLYPARFLLPSYSLQGNTWYIISLTVISVPVDPASANVSRTSVFMKVFIKAGAVVAVITGGNPRFIPVDQSVTFDASMSYDQNSASASLGYRWSCENIAFGSGFGSACDGLFAWDSAAGSSVTVLANKMSTSGKYAVAVTVFDKSNTLRFASTTTYIIPTAAGTPLIAISGPAAGVSISGRVYIKGYVTVANITSSVCSWSAAFAGYVVNITGALTPLQYDFSDLTVKNMAFPLRAAASGFVPGRSYTFSLTCCTLGTCSASAADVRVVGVPYGGTLLVLPRKGYALLDTFTLSSVGWIGSSTDSYPLTYSFSVRVHVSSPWLTIRSSTAVTYVSSTLPSGLQGYKFRISLASFIVDALGGLVNSTATAVVKPGGNINAKQILADSIAEFETTSNVEDLLTSLNEISSFLNIKNCSLAQNCSDLNRQECAEQVNTCGDCLSGYYGISGPSNIPCKNASSMTGFLGDGCFYDSDCAFGYCSSATHACSAPTPLCPSADPGTVCSGNGICTLLDASGNSFKNCTVLDGHCTPRCICSSGFGGVDCFLNTSDLADRDRIRASICTYQQKSFNFQDSSSEVVQSVGAALFSAYDPYEVLSDAGKTSCLTVMSSLGDLCGAGYISTVQDMSVTNLVEALSQFVVSNWSFTNPNATEGSESPLTPILGSIVSGIGVTLVEGQESVTVATANIRIAVEYKAISEYVNMSIVPPATDADTIYGTPQPALIPSLLALDTCGNAGYVQSSVVQWGLNPHPNSLSLASPLMQVSLFGQGRSLANGSSFVSSNPAYFIVIQFSHKLALNMTANSDPFLNRTLPECSYHDGIAYVSCDYCNISSYTGSNVTYVCYDAAVLCSSVSTVNRRSLLTDSAATDFLVERRGLSNGLTASDGGFATYGMVVTAVGAEITGVLSVNPFVVDLSKAKGVLIFLSTLVFLILCGVIVFSKWDANDHNKFEYIQSERLRLQREMVDRKRMQRQVHARAKREAAFNMAKFYTAVTSAFKFQVQQVPAPVITAVSKESRDIQYSKAVDAELIMDCDDTESVFTGTDHIDMEQSKTAAVTDFFGTAIPARTFLDHGHLFARYCESLVRFHPYICMVSLPSCMTTRTMRWLSVFRGILINLFVDTLFFGIFFPSNQTCPSFTSDADCLAAPSQVVAGANLCLWDPDKTVCRLNPPPADLTFTIVLALLTVICVMPAELLLGYIMDEFGARRPRLENWGWNSNYWLGSAVVSLSELDSHDSSVRVTGAERILKDSPLSGFIESVVMENNDKAPLNHLAAMESKVSGRMLLNASSTLRVENGSRTRKLLSPSDVLNDIVPSMVYFDYCTPEEELKHVLQKVKRFWLEELNSPFDSDTAPDLVSEKSLRAVNDAKATAFLDILHVYPNGTPMPLPFFQWLMYGTAHRKINFLIRKARRKAKDIVGELRTMEKLGMHNSVDIFLIQHFIMEQVGSLTKFALSKQMFNYSSELAPFQIDIRVWLLSWVVIIGLFVFFLYWIFAWGVVNGGTTLDRWGINFVVGTAQDFCFVQPLKILVLYILSVEAARPQLRTIHRRLIHMTTLLQREYESSRQHDFNVVQHASATCRAARMSSIGAYPAAFLLRQMTDLDIQCCRENKKWDFGTVIFVCIVVPALIGLISDLAVDGVMETLLPSLFASIVLFNNALYQISPALIVLPYALIGGFLLYFFALLRPSLYRAQRIRTKRLLRLRELSVRGSNASLQTATLRSSKKRKEETKRLKSVLGDKFARLVIFLSRPLFPSFIATRLEGWSTTGVHFKAPVHSNINKRHKSLTPCERDSRWQKMNIVQDLQGHEDVDFRDVNVPQGRQDYSVSQEADFGDLSLSSRQSEGTCGEPSRHESDSALSHTEDAKFSSSVHPYMLQFPVHLPEPIKLMAANDGAFLQYKNNAYMEKVINARVFQANTTEFSFYEDRTMYYDPQRKLYDSRPKNLLASLQTLQYKNYLELRKLDYITNTTDALQHIFMSACVLEGGTLGISRSSQFPLLKDLVEPVDAREYEVVCDIRQSKSVAYPALAGAARHPLADDWPDSNRSDPLATNRSDALASQSFHSVSGDENRSSPDGVSTKIRILIKFSEPTLAELVMQFWDIFLPGGFVLSDNEKNVIAAEFHTWCAATYQRKLTSIRYVSIFRFAEWYVSCVDDVVRAKNILQSFQFVPSDIPVDSSDP